MELHIKPLLNTLSAADRNDKSDYNYDYKYKNNSKNHNEEDDDDNNKIKVYTETSGAINMNGTKKDFNYTVLRHKANQRAKERLYGLSTGDLYVKNWGTVAHVGTSKVFKTFIDEIWRTSHNHTP